jgi:hypothetical protein
MSGKIRHWLLGEGGVKKYNNESLRVREKLRWGSPLTSTPAIIIGAPFCLGPKETPHNGTVRAELSFIACPRLLIVG